ncbi:MAG: argininosuccinate lyase [Bryobacteraceae bacterium]|nr:argininosuccinate lyase [Bryobacteraceae bacterium]
MIDKFPAPAYEKTVLAVNFADAQKYFLEALLDIDFAHAVMLSEQGMLSREEARAVLRGLRSIDTGELRGAAYDGSVEDFFFYVERELKRHCDPDIAGKLHTARSRNDIDITLYRMRIRTELLDLHRRIREAAGALLLMADEHRGTVMPAHTHTQPAQPTTLAHYLCAAIECFERDLGRIENAFATVNRNPLGSCAITTTGFPINRHRTADLLGFEGLQLNSYGSIAAVDYIAESASVVAVSLVNLGKLVQDFLLWCTAEFGYFRLAGGFVQISSIMPQKRNPVALEHTRILASRGLGEAQALLTALHNTPFGDIVDSEDDLQPLIFLMFEDAARAWTLFGAACTGIQVDRELLRQRAARRFLTVTELADTLVREEQISFHEAHGIVSQAVNANRADDSAERMVRDVIAGAPAVLGRELRTAPGVLFQALDPAHFVEIRNIPGGPGPAAIAQQIEGLRLALDGHGRWLDFKAAHLAACKQRLRAAVQGVC